ncbi:uncharacterized protein BXZ73DRAFT_43065 [Epithele typhae]|uniref:uncharacterized protein n=1 Tax=Epithele typhae TaxID=378194 RepID=UPI0020080F17|nr:uncharacterized protein BXZ73DRAFT_43065 [Epithele typhae]KAH9940080.1 hypothetical protein BXZ73DRAFT_43065 [Epithele typhae]
MRFYSGKIRAKPLWWEKINDSTIAAKWQAEMVEHDRVTHDGLWGGERRFDLDDETGSAKKWPRDPLTDDEIEYIFDELVYEASMRDPATGIFASAIKKAYESQSLIDGALKAQLVEVASAFENVPDDEKDWHPGSDNQVLDLVHPSLCPISIGQTYFRSTDPQGGDPVLTILDTDKYLQARPDLNGEGGKTVSKWYQWLPTDFTVSTTGEVAALGYINNAHPSWHRALYPAVTSIIARFIPMFERVLSDVISAAAVMEVPGRFPYEWYDGLEVESPKWESNAPDNDTFDERYEEWERKHKWPRIPIPAPFAAPAATDGRVEFSLKGRTVQVIVKLANIHLTPDKPSYPGGSWHVEGMLNERIVATGIYYYAMENVTESQLSFRQRVGGGDWGTDLPYEQDDHKGYRVAYGLGREEPLNQVLGHIVATADKCVAFPNVYQHHVDPFELEDKTRAGHRKILALFLVNPDVRILSTTDVPPQQLEWAMKEAEKAPGVQSLPRELLDMVAGFATEDGLMSREEAEEHRESLMEERSAFVDRENEERFAQKFSMCEH